MASLPFQTMWNLIVTNHQFLTFSTELLTAIFWEETMFQNIPQLGGPAVGFGQVEPGTIHQVNQEFGKKFTRQSILGSDDESVEVASLTLKMLFQRLRSIRASLNGYAGVSSRPQNAKLVQQWLRCENQLSSLALPEPLQSLSDSQIDEIKAALKKASPGSNPDRAFP